MRLFFWGGVYNFMESLKEVVPIYWGLGVDF